MSDVVIVEAVRTPIGKRNGGLSTFHPADLLAAVQTQRRAAVAWEEGRFDPQVVPAEAPVLGDDGKPTGETTTVTRDEGLRPTTAEGLASLKPVAREENGFHTAGTSSQISDAAAAVLLMSARRWPRHRHHPPAPLRERS